MLIDISNGKMPDSFNTPIEVFMNPHLTLNAIKLFGILYLFKSSKDGCFASNLYLSKIILTDERSVTRNLSLLEKWKYIKIENKKSTSRRRIFIDNNFIRRYRDCAISIYKTRKNPKKQDVNYAKGLYSDAKDKYLEESND